MNFVSETALEEKRRLRQEEWEKVRKPEDPVAAPEEEYDGRSLYDRLKEQKDKKQNDWDEAHKLKNMVRGLDDDEAGFLDFVDKTKLAEESRIMKEESDELEEYRKAVAKENEERLLTEVKSISSLPPATKIAKQSFPSIGIAKQSQKSSLSAFVKRKSIEKDGNTPDLKRMKSEEVPGVSTQLDVAEIKPANDLKCIAVLPGIGCYGDTSDSDDSSSDSTEQDSKFDLCGRPVNHNQTSNNA